MTSFLSVQACSLGYACLAAPTSILECSFSLLRCLRDCHRLRVISRWEPVRPTFPFFVHIIALLSPDCLGPGRGLPTSALAHFPLLSRSPIFPLNLWLWFLSLRIELCRKLAARRLYVLMLCS